MFDINKARGAKYNAVQTAKMVDIYSSDPSRETIDKLALDMGKSVSSIIAKLSREKVYGKHKIIAKRGKSFSRKEELINMLMSSIGLTEAEATSMINVNNTALNKMVDALTQ
jgi:hypothetical protein